MVDKEFLTASEIHLGLNDKEIDKKFVSGFLSIYEAKGMIKTMRHLVECPITKRPVKAYKLTVKTNKDYTETETITQTPQVETAQNTALEAVKAAIETLKNAGLSMSDVGMMLA
jgi:hypothetical protein